MTVSGPSEYHILAAVVKHKGQRFYSITIWDKLKVQHSLKIPSNIKLIWQKVLKPGRNEDTYSSY